MKLFRRHGRGFTLIELLTVIAIITILASLALGGIQVARKRARIAGTRAEVNHLAASVDQFYDDFGFYPPSWRESVRNLVVIPTASPIASPEPATNLRPWNFVDVDLDDYADALIPMRPPTDSSARNASYDENGIELLVLYLSTKNKNGAYFDTDSARLENQDNDRMNSNGPLYNSAFSKGDETQGYETELYEWVDLFGRPLVYVSFSRYNEFNGSPEFAYTSINLTLPTDGDDTDSDNDIDGKTISSTENNEYRRVTALDPKTADPHRPDSYVLYSVGPNGIDNLGYNDDSNGIDDDANGVVDDEDDITLW